MSALRLTSLLRFSTLGFFTLSALALLAIATGSAMAAPAKDLYKLCRQVKNDDEVLPYSHALYAGTVRAFKKLFPDAKIVPEEPELETQVHYRCMNGKLLACFVGANLPCTKMNASRDNPGADEFCKANPNEDFVPAAASGHDTVYSYKCQDGKAVVTGDTWALDERGFAKKLWAEVIQH
ncbi:MULTISPECIES: hypothetical protein [unclassified Mesorhizobium]|uniref:hypothetical protein n=1 Tax=unclassified Mesorhizobium TaxID=325217 RepID=UPI0011292F2A|nr:MULTISPECIES: hypothetical protein [unclassified Mesorhizobium]TPJ40955.1 hypothetical protein FJ437_25000 [Mesorhizobium sp. B2-6-6]MCA0008663.1 hypothetical protein [Mesorhizobium sp. B264B1B]MCA0019459.1 hypothetical protein [Mesorhizobium sp. B264B1A]MCA0024500.1 hypothetical protein [Mesorhizobium sp. B263B1A]MCA0055828.1 hypothetical protein [Mesorhizobium sp. B261B1A]